MTLEAITRRLRREFPNASEAELSSRAVAALLIEAAGIRAEVNALWKRGGLSSTEARETHARNNQAHALELAAFQELRRRFGSNPPRNTTSLEGGPHLGYAASR